MRATVSVFAVGLFAATSACSATDAPASVDGGVPATEPAAKPRSERGLHRALDALDALTRRAPRGATRAAPLTREANGWTPARIAGSRLVLPATAAATARLTVEGARPAWVEARAIGLRDAPGVVEGNTLVYEDVAAATDAIFLSDGLAFEELRVLHDATAPTRFTWRLAVDASIDHVRAREARIELVDATGFVRLATAPLTATDAQGHRRDLTVTTRRCGEGWCADAALDTAGFAYPVVVDPLWTAAPSMKTFHEDATLFRIAGGRWFIGGGIAPTCEYFDPATNTWTDLGQPPGQPTDFGVVQNAAGDMLVVGGLKNPATVNTVQKYTVATGTWSQAPGTLNFPGNASSPRTLLTRLSDGRILKYYADGGTTPLYSTEIYDGTKWTTNPGPTAVLSVSRGYPVRSAVTLPDGRTFLTMLSIGPTVYSHLIFDPKTNGWFRTADEPIHASQYVPATTPRATLLADGRVLVTDGPIGTSQAAPIYNPVNNTWAATGGQIRPRYSGNVVRLPNGRVLSATGGGSASRDPFTIEYLETEIYDPTLNTWTGVEPLPSAGGVEGAAMALLDDGRVMVAGGQPLASYSQLAFFYTPAANGAACSYSGFGCASGTCTEGVCCEKASCGAGSTCASAAFPGKCVKVQGTACAADAECGTGHCVDGVCCASACAGLCAKCNGATPGVCVNQVGAPLASRGSCPAGGATTCSQYTCDGKTATSCVLAPSTTSCSSTGCAAGVETHASFCDGAGKCADVAKVCAPYVCGASAKCLSTCSTTSDCASNAYCKGGMCVALEGLGGKCMTATDCVTGAKCVDGVCCAPPAGLNACPTGSTCAAPGKEGSCTKSDGTVCADGSECASGSCADGVCCDTACNGQCEACDVPDAATGAKGKCVPIAGAPHGTMRAACTKGSGDAVCTTAVCDGTTTTSCAGLAGSETSCRDESCVAGTYTSPASCNGSGTCPTVMTVPCGGYGCTDDAKKCRTSCAQASDCASGFACRNGTCAKIAATCSDDGLSSTPLGGVPKSCAPFICNTDGTCRESCSTTSDCAPGNLCDPVSGKCTAAPSEQASGGCAVEGATGGSDTSAGGAGLLGLALGLGLVARSRRATKRR
jgi:hypothetical protein